MRSDAFTINLLVLIATLVQLGLIFYHADELSQFENQIKQYVAALAVLLTIRRYPVQLVLWGAALGCVLATAVALGEVYIFSTMRADGPTNAVRFGMIAALLSMLCWAGALFGQLPRASRIFFALAGIAGIYAVFASGSRSALVAMPVTLLMLLPGVWRRSRLIAISAGLLFLAFSVVLGAWQMKVVRYKTAGTETLVEAPLIGNLMLDQSIRDRIVMLELSAALFASNPWFGVGDKGWDRAVAEQRISGGSGGALEVGFNQAHNQYANDFAKGGLLRGCLGIAMLLLPMFLFLRRQPFKPGAASLAPLLGVVTCMAYTVFGLAESVMDLSLTASLYIVLVFYLMASAEGAPMTHPMRARPLTMKRDAA